MSRLAANILANLAGQGWSTIISLFVIPFYIKLLHIEAYGLIGFYGILQTLSQVLDLGLSPTINREMARYSDRAEKAGEARDLVRTLEVAYWAIGICIGVAVIISAPLIANHWLKTRAIPVSDVQRTLILMGILMALQWPINLYGSGLMGLQKQLALNIVSISMSAVSSGGAVLILWLVSPTITAFFTWQILVAAINVAVFPFLLWRSLPPSDRAPHLDFGLVRNVRRFAAGMAGLGLSGIILAQLDKVILSKLLSLEIFGYYSVAGALGRGLYVLITPVFNAFFPRFSALAVRDDGDALKHLYHLGSQLMAALIIPVGVVVSLFSYDVLLLWTRNADTARNAALVASLLVIGTILNGLMNLPYALQLAYGWTELGLYINSFFIVVLVPALVYATLHYGPVGAAGVWVALNTLYVLVGVPFTHKRLLKGEGGPWFRVDVCLPFLAVLPVAWLGRWILVGPMSPLASLGSLSLVLVCSLFAGAAAAPRIREWMLIHFAKVASSRIGAQFRLSP